MKKGDIVQLKEGQFFSQKDAEDMGYKDPSQIPDTLEVSRTGMTIICCTPVAIFEVEGIPNVVFWSDNFEVVLEAGEPNMAKLLEESKKQELAWIGM